MQVQLFTSGGRTCKNRLSNFLSTILTDVNFSVPYLKIIGRKTVSMSNHPNRPFFDSSSTGIDFPLISTFFSVSDIFAEFAGEDPVVFPLLIFVKYWFMAG